MDAVVAVFKTNISDKKTAEQVSEHLFEFLPASRISFDLEDCDRILRVETDSDIEQLVSGFLSRLGYHCEPL